MTSPLLEAFDQQIQTIPQALYMTNSNFSGRPANMFKEDGIWKTISYNELLYNVECVAAALIKLGIQSGDLTGIKAHNSPRWTWADLASIFCGAATVSFYPTLSRKETTTIANHSQIKLLFLDDVDRLLETMTYLEDMPELKYLVCLEKGFKGNGKNVYGMDEILEIGKNNHDILLTDIQARIADLNADSPATMVYTSGTTGEQKGAMHSQKSILYSCTRGYRHLESYGQAANYEMLSLCFMPICHIMAKVQDYFGPLFLGGCIGFSSPATFMQDMQIIRPTWITPVPRIVSRLYVGFENSFSATEMGKQVWDWAIDVAVKTSYELEDKDGYIDTTIPYEKQLSGQAREDWINANNAVYWRIKQSMGGRVRDLNAGGAYLDPDLQRKFVGMGIYLTPGYGLTESGAGVNEGCPNKFKIGWISPPNYGVEEKLDEDGEVLIKGNGIVNEYYKNEKANVESFTPDGFFKSGDIGEFDKNGYLRIVDRKKNLIILDTGKNVAAGRLEALCANSGLIAQSVFLGQDRKFVSALIVPNFDAIIGLFDSKDIPYDKSKVKYGLNHGLRICTEVGEDIVNNELLISLIEDEIAKINQQVESFEAIRQYRLLSHRLSEEAGELTPTEKVKMRVIEVNYKDLIEDIYK